VRIWTEWLAAPRSDTGITMAGAGFGASPHRLGYPQLAELAAQWAAWPDWVDGESPDAVLAIATPGPALFAAFTGLVGAGVDVGLIAPPAALADRETYARHLAAALEAVNPRLILCDERFVQTVRQAVAGPAEPEIAPLPADGRPDAAGARKVRLTGRAGPGDLLQLTSGSSGIARCVQLSPQAVSANLAAMTEWISITGTDTLATWLPLYHDMGLVGSFLLALSAQIDLRLMEPADFVRNPAAFLAWFGRGPATLAGMPPFGLELMTRRGRDADLAGMDLSSWRVLIVGAERISATVLDRFADRFAPYGFDAGALCPAYGLAEAALAITGSAPGRRPTATALEDASGGPVVSCGAPLPGAGVRVVDTDGRNVTGAVGEIVVTSPSLARGYRGTASGSARFAHGELWTGDAGFLSDGELHVIGRIGDAVKIRGTWLFAEDLEACLDHAAFREGRAAVLIGQQADEVRVLLIHERRTVIDPSPLTPYLRARSLDAKVTAVPVPARELLRTSSGKPRRRDMWLRFGATT